MQWLGLKRIAFVPVFRSRDQTPDQIPADFAEQILRLALYNPTPSPSGPDRSLRAWVRAASSGRADMDAAVLPLQTTDRIETLPADFEDALGGQLRSQGFDHACLVMLTGPGATNNGFWSRALLKEGLGRWMMEMLHGITGFPDLYHYNNDVDPEQFAPDTFDEMSAATFTHPTIFTKLHLGWADPSTVSMHNYPIANYELQIVALTQPPAGGRAAAVQIGSNEPYMMIEARTKADAFDAGIADEGVIAYRVQWANPVIQVRPNFRKPVYMLTPQSKALKVGESLVLDNNVTLNVNAAVPGGFAITVSDPNLHHTDRTAQTGATDAAGAPTAIVLDQAGIDDIAYRDTSGHLREIWRDPVRLGQGDLSTNASAPAGEGNPWFYYDPSGNQFILLYRSPDGRVHSLYWLAGNVGHDVLNNDAPKAAGDPSGWFSGNDNTHHVVYRTSNGHLQELWWQGSGTVGNGDLTEAAHAVPSKGDPSPYYDATHGTNIVAFRGTDDRIRTLYWTSGDVGHDDLSGTAGTPAAADDPFAWHAAADDSHHCIYRASNGHVYELSWIGDAPVTGRDLTALTGAPPASGRLSGGYNAYDNTQHAIYRASDGSLHELWYFLGSGDVGHTALTAAYGGPPAVDRPVYFSTARAPHQHVAYRSSDGHIHELLW
jgi:hypothetical protein